MNLYVNEKCLILLKEMDVVKTTVEHHLLKMFPEGPALHIATVVPRSKTELARRAAERLKYFYGKLTHQTMNGRWPSFERYTKNVKYNAFGVYSYSTQVIDLNWEIEQRND